MAGNGHQSGRLRRARVLWLIKQLGAGGAERLLINAARAHDRDAFEFEAAYVLQWNDALVAELESTGTPVHSLGVNSAFDPRWLTRLIRLLRRSRFDILHVHSPLVASLCRPVVRALPPSFRPLIVVTEHASWHSYRLPTRVLNTLTLPLDDAHIAVSDSSRSAMPSWLRSRSRVIAHGVPIHEVAGLRGEREEVRRELGIGADDVLVVTVANLVPDKDYPTLLGAARHVLEGELPVRFVAAGRGPLEEELRELHRRLGLGSGFTFLGFRKDAIRLMAGADIFTLASRYEGYPVAVMEALAVGAPVVATAVGGVPEAVRDGREGLVVEAGNPDALAEAISTLAADPVRRAVMAAAAAERGLSFDIAKTTAAIEQIYRHALDNRLAAPRRRPTAPTGR